MTEKRRRRKSRARERPVRAAGQATWLEWPPGPTRSALLVLAALVLVTLAVYGNALRNDFVFDDHDLVVEYEQIRSLENTPEILGLGDERRRYRPVRFVSYTIDHLFFGMDPFGYHLFNLAYHAATAFMVYLIGRRLTGSGAIALFAALVFTVHPVQADSVTYISGRRDVLSGLLFLLGFYVFLRHRQGPRVWHLPAIVVLFVLGLFTKEMAVTLPVMFFIYDFCNRYPELQGRVNLGAAVKAIPSTALTVLARQRYLYIPTIAIAAAFVVFKVFISNPSRAEGAFGDSFLLHILTILNIQLTYLRLLAFPVTLNADYSGGGVPVATSVVDPMSLVALLVFAAIAVGLLLALGKNRTVAFAGLWYFAAMLPASQIVRHHEALAEHYLYLPLIGVALLAGVAFQKVADWPGLRPYAYAGGAALLVLFSARTAVRNLDWRDEATFWAKTVQTAPTSARAHYNLGLSFHGSDQLDMAITHYQEAVRLEPDRVEAHNNLGGVYYTMGSLQNAQDSYREATRLSPDSMEYHMNLGRTLGRAGLNDQAIASFQTAVDLKPDSAQARSDLATAYLNTGQVDEARGHYLSALDIDPRIFEAHLNLGAIHQSRGELSEAIEEFKMALTIRPDYTDGHLRLARLYLGLDDHESALEQLRVATTVAPGHREIEAMIEEINARSSHGE